MMNKGTMGHYSGGVGDQRGGGGVVGEGMGYNSCRVSHGMMGNWVGYNRGVMSNWVSHNRGVMSNWVSYNRGVMSNWVANKGGVLQERLVRTGDTFVFNISVVLLIFINKVINNLGPAVRQLNPVLSLHNWSLSGFSSGMMVGVAIGIVIIHLESKGVILRGLFMVGFGMIRGRVVRDYRGVVHQRSGSMVYKGSGSGVMHQWGGGVMNKRSRGVM